MAIDRVKVKKEADKLLAAGKVERAIDEFQKLVDDNPKDYNTQNQIGDLFVQAGRLKEGVEIHKRLASAYERDGFHARAAAILQKVVRNAADDIEAAQRLADLYRQMNKPTDAIKVYLQVAEHFQKKGLIKRALEEFNKVVDLDPKNLKMKVKLADLYNKEGMKDKAAGIYLEVAESLAMEQMHAEAKQILDRAKGMISTPQLYLTQSRLAVIQSDYGSAAQHLREGLGRNPRNTELLEALSEIEMRSGHPERALEALGEVPQLPEKSLPLCEKALRALAKADRVEEGLRLFSPIARELARRGAGETVGRTIRTALQGNIGLEAWMLLAEIAHQSGNRGDQIHALQSAYGIAHQHNDVALATHLTTQLQALGAVPGAAAPPPSLSPPPMVAHGQGAHHPPVPGDLTSHGHESEVDPVRRLRIEQLSREAEGFLRSGSTDRAIETYKKALEMAPADLTIIEAIASIHRTTGRVTQAQMQYVQSAQVLAQLGKKRQAIQLLDLAEQLFPGSTRIHRRTLGLLDGGGGAPAAPAADPFVPHPQASAPHALPLSPVPVPPQAPIPVPMPTFPATPPAAPPPLPVAPQMSAPPITDMDMLIGLDVPGFEPPPPAKAPAPLAPFQPIALGDGLPLSPAMPPSPPPAAFDASDLAWMDATLSEAGLAPDPAVPVTAPPAMQPVSGAATGLSEPVPEELASLLGDIDFQLDYGNPDEAMGEIQSALSQFPGHPELKIRLDRVELALHKLGHAPKASALDESDFADSFFDLTDVLGTALLDSGEGEEMHDTTRMVEKIQSVDELFSAFREGVEKQVNSDDYDTHYNLGIAYKEMMLIEPAIEEFKIAMGDPERTLECCSMLSICEQVRGDLAAAVEWLRKGIATPGFPPEDSIGLRYDLGEIFLQLGQTAEATREFKAVYQMDSDYRDVAARVH